MQGMSSQRLPVVSALLAAAQERASGGGLPAGVVESAAAGALAGPQLLSSGCSRGATRAG